MKIEINENLGDKIYEIRQESITKKEPCPHCEGEGVLYSKTGSNSVMCPQCVGLKRKLIHKGSKWVLGSVYSLDSIKIVKGSIMKNEPDLVIHYYTHIEFDEEPTDITKNLNKTLFFSKEEAEKECEKRKNLNI